MPALTTPLRKETICVFFTVSFPLCCLPSPLREQNPPPHLCLHEHLYLSQSGCPGLGIRNDTKQSNMEICKEAKSAHHEVLWPACAWASVLVLSCASLFSPVQAATFLPALYEIVRRLILGCFIILPCKDTVSCQNQQHVAPLGAAIL